MKFTDIFYAQIPSAQTFKEDTSIRVAIRSHDRILKHIDWLLERYYAHYLANNYAKYMVILTDLFHTCNFWLKGYYERNPLMKQERYLPVRALFDAVVDQLRIEFQCERAMVSRILDETFGRDLTAEVGLKCDLELKRAKYFLRQERQIYRLHFKGGIAYQHCWWKQRPSMKLVPAESRYAYDADLERPGQVARVKGSHNFGGFVLTMEREIYMAKHDVGDIDGQNGLFHSSYMAGDRVAMAGTMFIHGGIIRAVREDSGHYQPTEMNMTALLQALGMYGVVLRRVILYDYNGKRIGPATDFMKDRLDWSRFVARRQEEQKHRVKSDDKRDALGKPRRFPHLQPPAPPQQAQVPIRVRGYGSAPVASGQADDYILSPSEPMQLADLYVSK